MKNLGSRWTVPDIARTAAARSSFLVAISLERDSGSSSSSSSSSSKSSIRNNRNKIRSSGSTSDNNGISSNSSISNSSNSSSSSTRVTAIDKKRESKNSGRSAIDVLHGSPLSVRPYVTASCDRIVGTTHPESTTPRNRPVAGKSRRFQHRTRRPHQPQQQLYYPPASWDTRTLHFRNC
ncbi:pinin-like [Pogonomyrmex barbatus]|uniref:Pinin-like n=1 Tax=Pogonomyrmex barbatus TaxID=144034 RepID=A0A6I9WBT1_9HYME|nr:pinin-like [Pogonomyrmex barbatus]XP_011636386.1 pinin-like [Pogonomyrmex barbatus]